MDRIGMSVACFEMSGFSIDVDKIFLAIRLDGDIPAVMFAAQLWSDLLEYRPTTLLTLPSLKARDSWFIEFP
jgi:hypothetical protein